MFTLDIVDSDAFLDMPLSTQALYFHLAMRADDDGFIGSAKKIARTLGVADDDMKVLLAKRFVLPFQSGVMVIKHWRMHNLIRHDRHHGTVYKEEKELLAIKENGAYTEINSKVITLPEVVDKWQPNGNQMATEVRLGKDRLDINTNVLTDASHPSGSFFVNTILDEFSNNWGFRPTDRKPRFVANTFSKQIKSFLKVFNPEVTEERFVKVVKSYFNWITGQDYSEKIETLETVRRKFPMWADPKTKGKNANS